MFTLKHRILIPILVSATISAALHFLAVEYYLYWAYWWYDVLLHFSVGFTGGLSLYWGFFETGLIFKAPKTRAFCIVAVTLGVFAWGVAWEVFEYAYGITDSHEGYVQDTVNDLILDTSGAVLAALIATRKKRHG